MMPYGVLCVLIIVLSITSLLEDIY